MPRRDGRECGGRFQALCPCVKVPRRNFSEALSHVSSERLVCFRVLGTGSLVTGPVSLLLWLLGPRELDWWPILTLLQKGATWYIFLCVILPPAFYSHVLFVLL